VEMNQTHMGRYVFSGFHTDQPPVLVDNHPYDSFVITQRFMLRDIEQIQSFQNLNPVGLPDVHNVNILKLPYRDLDMMHIPGLNVVFRSVNDTDAYMPPNVAAPPPVVHFIQETGELVFSDAALEAFPPNGLDITYLKTGFSRGELNPRVYFPSVDVSGLPAGAMTPLLLEQLANIDNREAIMAGLVPAEDPRLLVFNAADHEIRFEFSTNTYVAINSLAQDAFTPQMYADLRRLFEFVESITFSDPKVLENHFRSQGYVGYALQNRINTHMSDERAMVQGVLGERASTMLHLHERHSAQFIREHTHVGTRMARLEMLQIRLEEEEVQYTALLSENEDTNMTEAILRKTNAQAAFQAALRSSAMVVQLSLVNFIR